MNYGLLVLLLISLAGCSNGLNAGGSSLLSSRVDGQEQPKNDTILKAKLFRINGVSLNKELEIRRGEEGISVF